MNQLLVRKIDTDMVQKLKARARAYGISTEEAHRRILQEALNQPDKVKRSLIEYLITMEVAPDIELEMTRSTEIEERDTGL